MVRGTNLNRSRAEVTHIGLSSHLELLTMNDDGLVNADFSGLRKSGVTEIIPERIALP